MCVLTFTDGSTLEVEDAEVSKIVNAAIDVDVAINNDASDDTTIVLLSLSQALGKLSNAIDESGIREL
jgi:hypothetical protein